MTDTTPRVDTAAQQYHEGMITAAEIAAELGATGVAKAIRKHAADLARPQASPAPHA